MGSIFFGLVAIGFAAIAIHHQRMLRRRWEEAASALGLQYSCPWGRRRLTGMIGDCSIRTETRSTKGQGTWTHISVGCERRIPDGVQIRKERALELKKLIGGEDIQTGDAMFDAAAYISGSRLHAVGFLGPAARQIVSRLLVYDGHMKDGRFEFHRHTGDVDVIVSGINHLVLMVSELPELAPPGRMLLANVALDTDPGARLRSLRLLCERYGSQEEFRREARAFLGDADPEIRLCAASLSRSPEASAVIRAVLESTSLSDELRLEAVRAAGASTDRSLVEPLHALVHRHDPKLAEALAAALGALGDPESETPLLRLLSRESRDVKRAAASALGKVGTVRAVEALLEAGGDEARDAVRRIQERIGPGERGGLSLASGETAEGALSVTGEGGEVSVVPKPVKG